MMLEFSRYTLQTSADEHHYLFNTLSGASLTLDEAQYAALGAALGMTVAARFGNDIIGAVPLLAVTTSRTLPDQAFGAKDRVAIANAATTGFSRDGGEVSAASLALDACVSVLRDTGLTRTIEDPVYGEIVRKVLMPTLEPLVVAAQHRP